MAFVTPLYSRGQVRRAGEILCVGDPTSVADVMPIITNWRAAHAYPLNTFQATLRRRLRTLGTRAAERSLVGERLKRLPSIEAKLRRQVGMKLERMQDIAGLRAVVPDMAALKRLHAMYATGGLAHELRSTHNYVQSPKDDGYRSIHLVYRYNSRRAPIYNGLSVELQMRTRLQHAWATGVETVDIFAKQAIKAGNPDPKWAVFFRLASAAFALQEGTPQHKDFEGQSIEEISAQLADAEEALDVLFKLRGFRLAAKAIHGGDRSRAAYHLVVLNTATQMLRVTPFSEARLQEANESYAEVERLAALGEPLDPVLVAGGSVDQLRKTYPNYFLDAGVFIEKVARLCKRALLPVFPRNRYKLRAPESLSTAPPQSFAIAARSALSLSSGWLSTHALDPSTKFFGPSSPAFLLASNSQNPSRAVVWSDSNADTWAAGLLPPLPPTKSSFQTNTRFQRSSGIQRLKEGHSQLSKNQARHRSKTKASRKGG